MTMIKTRGLAASGLTERQFARIIITTVVIGFFALALVVGMTVWLLVRSQEFGGLVEHTYRVESRISAFRVQFERAEAARRGYLIAPDPRYTRTYAGAEAQLQPILGELRELTADNPVQIAHLDELHPLIDEKRDLMRQTLDLRRSGDVDGALLAFASPREQVLLDRLRALTEAMAADEQALLNQRTERQTGNAQALAVVVGVAGVLLALLAAISLWAMRRFAVHLTRSEAKLRVLNEGLEAAVQERTVDLTRANEEIQRFAYIVSHDLRSPLVNIMGFTSELEAATKPLQKMIAEVDAAAPDAVSTEARTVIETELPESIDFIRSSTRKMDRLINAILKLSREGRRNLNPEPLAMDALAHGVVDSLRFMADQKGAEIVVEGKLPDIVGDRVAMEQVLSNLVENALKYLKPGRPGLVRIRGRVEGPRVVYEVEDNGRGVDPRDHERIFELFRRAGAQDQPGEGIGLAHVRALVYRLGGLINCSSALDQGATFRLSLPRTLTREGETPA
jgi:signal transduction histidine kinase